MIGPKEIKIEENKVKYVLDWLTPKCVKDVQKFLGLVNYYYRFIKVIQTLFSLYLYNKWTDFHKLSCTVKPKIRAICTYVGGTKATTND